jgi:protein-S-isoprenylcysteine O-methyltransferase Ste14
VPTTTVRLLAVLMAVAHGTVWVLGSRWGRPGRTARLRASLRAPPPIVRAGYGALLIPLLYPAFVAAAPGWGYEGPLNWSSRLQGVGLGLWITGVIVLVWAIRVLGHYLEVDGVTEDHELVASGPYRYVRHPVYSAFAAVAAGLGLVFRSYLLAAVAAVWLAAAMWWAAEEETLLAAPDGLGEAYRAYSERTGRFLPRLWKVR